MIELLRTFNNVVLSKFGFQVELLKNVRARREEIARIGSLQFSAVARARIVDIARIFIPADAIDFEKVRLGRDADGGYVCLDDFKPVIGVLSAGISDECSWDLAIASKGIAVYQFDHTVESAPSSHNNFRFQSRKIVPTGCESSISENSIVSILAQQGDAAPATWILKMDIEGDEWRVLSSTPDSTLNAFSQIICEFHGFKDILDDGWWSEARLFLKRLNNLFQCVHVHGNNGGGWAIIGNVPFPDVLEVTFANRSRYKFKGSSHAFPTGYDFPNDRLQPDMFLGIVEGWRFI